MSNILLWNFDKTECIEAGKIKRLVIVPVDLYCSPDWENVQTFFYVLGCQDFWCKDLNKFEFGFFESLDEAKVLAKRLEKEINRKGSLQLVE